MKESAPGHLKLKAMLWMSKNHIKLLHLLTRSLYRKKGGQVYNGHHRVGSQYFIQTKFLKFHFSFEFNSFLILFKAECFNTSGILRYTHFQCNNLLNFCPGVYVKTEDPKEKPAQEGLTALPTEIEASRE